MGTGKDWIHIALIAFFFAGVLAFLNTRGWVSIVEGFKWSDLVGWLAGGIALGIWVTFGPEHSFLPPLVFVTVPAFAVALWWRIAQKSRAPRRAPPGPVL